LQVDVAVQSVENSDRAAMIDVRAMHGSFGFGASTNSYSERNRLSSEPRHIRMDLWALFGALRLISAPNTHIDLLGGFTGARSNQFEALLGATIGMEFVYGKPDSLSVVASGRYFALDEGIHAYEGRFGLRASYAYLGYRALKFTDAPPLRGPEAGLSLRF